MLPEPRETWHFDTAHIGRRVFVFDTVDSTNAVATRGSPENGLVVLAHHQTAGRGQYGRVWQSEPSRSLLLSVVLTPPAEFRRPVVLTALAAVAVGEAVFALTGVQAKIKWPNDLLVRGKKVCGILIEQGHSTVVGIGLNLNQTAEEFAAAGLPDATSLHLVSGRAIDHRTAAGVLVRHLDAEYGRLLAGERVAVEADWKWRVGLLGRHVVVELTGGGAVEGRLLEMGFDGLALEAAGGFVRTIVPETVAHVRAE